MADIFKELRDLREKWENYDLTEQQINKLKGDCDPGCTVNIYWNNGSIDCGYVFIVDGMDAEIGDCFVHIPQPDNPGGKDVAPPEWAYMINLMTNDLVEEISCFMP